MWILRQLSLYQRVYKKEGNIAISIQKRGVGTMRTLKCGGKVKMKSVRIEKEINVVGDYDTVVCSGGPAGFVAAISAARCGKRTALIERYGFLGGTATAGIVVPISGFFFKGKQVVGGIAFEFGNEF